MSRRTIPIGVRSMYGARTEQPLVILHVGDEAPQLTPDGAREIAHWLLEAAESAEHDAALIGFCQRLDLPQQFAGQLLTDLRKARNTGRHDTEVEGPERDQ